MIAAKAFAEPAVFISTADRMDQTQAVTTCQLHMRKFKDGDTIVVEPWRARPFPVIKDLVVDRSAFDKIIAAGGYISVNTGGVPDANTIPVPQRKC